MKALTIALVAAVLVSCSTQTSGYRRLPAQYLSIDPSTKAETFVFEICPAFEDPVAYRFEFFTHPTLRAVKTSYSFRDLPERREMNEKEAERIRAALLSFDWNRVEDPKVPGVVRMVPDDVVILFRARFGAVYHEASIGLSESTMIERLLREIEVIK